MDHRPQLWGRPRDGVYGPYDHSFLATVPASLAPKKAASKNMVTGTSIVAIKFAHGVVIATDKLGSSGSLAKFRDVKRLRVFDDRIVLGFGGDVSDMQYLDRYLTELDIDESYEISESSNHRLNAANLHRHMGRLMYHRRNKFNPLWNQILVAGFDDGGKPFLASADLRGTTFTAPSLATGYGAHMAQPIMRRRVPDEDAVANLSRDDALQIVRDCMKVLYYRDARSLDTYDLAVVTKDGIEMMENEKVEAQSWAFAENVRGYGSHVSAQAI